MLGPYTKNLKATNFIPPSLLFFTLASCQPAWLPSIVAFEYASTVTSQLVFSKKTTSQAVLIALASQTASGPVPIPS